MLRPAPRASILATLAVLVAAAVVTGAVLADPAVVSVSDTGQGNAAGTGAAVSADGRYVAFTSSDALAGVDNGGVRQLYVRDRVSGRTLLASAAATGEPADAQVDDPATHRAYAISGDGRYVVFASQATNLAADDPDGSSRDVFRKDLVTGAVATVSRAPGGAQVQEPVGGDPDVSFDGSRVVYETGVVTDLWTGDSSMASDVVLRDLTFGATTLVATGGSQASVSADGRHVAYELGTSVLVRDTTTAAVVTVPNAAAPDLSGDGSVVAFTSGAGVARRQLPSGSAAPVATPGAMPAISADGRRVVYEVPGSPAHVWAQLAGSASERVSERADGSASSGPSVAPAIGGNGATVAFTHDDLGGTLLAQGDTDGQPDVLAASLVPTDPTGPNVTLAPPSPAGSQTQLVSGTATDPSGVVAVTVGGLPAAVDPSGAFSVEVPLAAGMNVIAIRATDGAGNVSDRPVTAERAVPVLPKPALKARARSLRIMRIGRTTVVRFRLDKGAKRVTTRLWRRVPRFGAPPGWTPVGSARVVARTAGARAALLSRTPLRPDIYQVRVSVVSAGGVAVTVLRYRVLRSGNR